MTTVVTYHPATCLHQAWAGHPERPERIEVVLEALRAPALVPLVTWVEAAYDPSVRYVSLHQSPWYPGTGAAEERGVGNVFNVPRPPGLPRAIHVRDLLEAVDAALAGWAPEALLVSAGFDSLAGDPLGDFPLLPEDVATWTAELRARLAGRPVIAVLEGGYRLDLLSAGVMALVRALA